jgi:hypothetical protein
VKCGTSVITLRVEWTGDKDLQRANVIAGMQIEAFRRKVEDQHYFCPSAEWQYKIVNGQGEEICWGLARTRAAVKRAALRALQKRIY